MTESVLPKETVLPRQLADGLFWLGDCIIVPYKDGLLHTHNSSYLVVGEERSAIVDTGPPKDWPVLERQLDDLLATGIPPITHLFTTHVEGAHSGNVGRIAKKWPELRVCGDVRDFHLIFPEAEDQLEPMDVGDSIDLGGTRIEIVKAVIRDVSTSRWAYDTGSKTLFPGDGFAYFHLHEAGQCGHTAEEVPDLPFIEMSLVLAKYALYWTRFTDVEPHIAELRAMLERYPCEVIAPGHGLPISDPVETVPKIEDGLRVRDHDVD